MPVVDRSLLPCEALVEQRQDLRDIKLDILEIEIVLAVLLHLEQVIELQIKLEQTTGAA